MVRAVLNRLPPLQLLPAFEAASRLLSFSKAAVELHVTTAAISQQIKQLEGLLGLPLFQRLTRRVELTEAGRDFALVAAQTLAIYRLGHANLIHRHTRPILRISMTPLVAHELLIPNLVDFQAANPGVDIRIESSMDLADFDHDPVDAAIRFGSGQWPGLEALPLCKCQAHILASPALLQRLPVNSIGDLKHHILIHPRHNQADWNHAAKLLGVERIERKGDLVMDSDLAMVNAAERGLGVTLCVLSAYSNRMAFDRLVQVFPPIDLPWQAYFVFRPHSGKEALLMNAYQWIKANIDGPSG